MTHINNPSDDELRKVVDILKPKFPRQPGEKVTNLKPSHRYDKPFLRIGGIAAMVCLCATIAFGLMFSVKGNAVPASQIVEQSIAEMSKADSYRIEFNYRGRISSDDEIYRANPEAGVVSGTLYVFIHNGIPLTRIDWNDSQHNTAIWNGKRYIHVKDGKVVTTKPAKPLDELYQLLSFKTLPKDIIKVATINETGGKINVTLKKSNNSEIHGMAQFSRADKRLEKVTFGTKDIDVMSTDSISYGMPLPVEMFMLEQ